MRWFVLGPFGVLVALFILSVVGLNSDNTRAVHTPCWHGWRGTYAYGPLPGWHVINENLGPQFFRIYARGFQWPGGTVGWLQSKPGLCTPQEAEAYGRSLPPMTDEEAKDYQRTHPDE